MKVDPNLDVQNHPQLNQPASTRFESGPSSQIHAPIADDFSEMFSQEVARNATSLSERQLGLRTPPAEQLVQLYEQLGHPAQAKMATIARNVRGQLLLRAGVGKIMQITGNDGYPVVLANASARTKEGAERALAGLAIWD